MSFLTLFFCDFSSAQFFWKAHQIVLDLCKHSSNVSQSQFRRRRHNARFPTSYSKLFRRRSVRGHRASIWTEWTTSCRISFGHVHSNNYLKWSFWRRIFFDRDIQGRILRGVKLLGRVPHVHAIGKEQELLTNDHERLDSWAKWMLGLLLSRTLSRSIQTR